MCHLTPWRLCMNIDWRRTVGPVLPLTLHVHNRVRDGIPLPALIITSRRVFGFIKHEAHIYDRLQYKCTAFRRRDAIFFYISHCFLASHTQLVSLKVSQGGAMVANSM